MSSDGHRRGTNIPRACEDSSATASKARHATHSTQAPATRHRATTSARTGGVSKSTHENGGSQPRVAWSRACRRRESRGCYLHMSRGRVCLVVVGPVVLVFPLPAHPNYLDLLLSPHVTAPFGKPKIGHCSFDFITVPLAHPRLKELKKVSGPTTNKAGSVTGATSSARGILTGAFVSRLLSRLASANVSCRFPKVTRILHGSSACHRF